mmetsp:Transcript_15820/g.21994  ORF Transcript_15820/g.21994 Transcript_15820/m.21994 type:complete len:115 (+) Transcript_15820:210-554(+)
MMEIPLSMVAWMSVVLFQAVVHFGIIGPNKRRRLEQEMLLLETLEEVEEAVHEDDEISHVDLSYTLKYQHDRDHKRSTSTDSLDTHPLSELGDDLSLPDLPASPLQKTRKIKEL